MPHDWYEQKPPKHTIAQAFNSGYHGWTAIAYNKDNSLSVRYCKRACNAGYRLVKRQRKEYFALLKKIEKAARKAGAKGV